MCDVSTAIAGASLALAAGGTAMQIQGQNEARSAQQRAVADEVTRQQQARRKQLAEIDAASQQVSRDVTDKVTQDATQARQEQYAAATPAETGYLPGQAAGSQVVRDAVDQKRGEVSGFVGQQGQALANLGGWADALFGARRAISRAGQSVALEGSNARASASLLEPKVKAAGYAGMGARTAGDIATGFGNLGLGGAFTPAGKGGAGAPSMNGVSLGGTGWSGPQYGGLY